VVQQFIHQPADYERWAEWDSLDLPVLCRRGEQSDLLLRETTEAMRQRGPRALVVEVSGCGHAPALNTPEQFAIVNASCRGLDPRPLAGRINPCKRPSAIGFFSAPRGWP
jgi:pimeloyl-ACP methyl ester carboxylesterase